MAEPTDKDTRGPVNLRIKFRSESLQQFIERYGVDVSRGGIFIRTREPLPVGTRLKLDFQLVDTVPLFQGDGTVVWIREHDASRAGVTPGMGVRFDRLTTESQTTLDTILEEKIRLQQSGVAPGSVAKAGAGIAVRRPSGAFATIEAGGAKPGAGGPPPLPFEIKPDAKPDVPAAPAAPAAGAAPVSPMPASSTRSGPHGTGSSIFNRPRTTSGLRTVPVPSALFEPPTAADIDKALSVLEEKGGVAPVIPVAPTVVHRDDGKINDDDPTRVFDSSASQEFSQNDAITGKGEVLPETGVPVASEGGELTERRIVDPASGEVKADGMNGAAAASADGAAKRAEPLPAPGAKQPAPLDAPLASLVDSGAAPAAKPAPPPPTKPAASPGKAAAGVPMKISTDARPAATESGRFRSDTRYKRKRGKGLYYALAILLIGGGVAASGLYVKREREKRAAAAVAAAAASPPIGAGQLNTPPANPPPPAPGIEATGAGGAAAPTNEAAGTGAPAPEKTEPPRPEAVVAKPEKAAAPAKPEGGKAGEKTATAEKAQEGATPVKRRREKAASASATTPATTEKSAEAAGEKKPAEAAGEAKPGAEAAKTETSKPAETAKPAEGGEAKPAEGAKPAEAAATVPAVLKITSTPAGAEVVIDGVPVGNTPFTSKEISADSTHAITVKKDGFETHERMISGSDWSRGKGGAQSLKFNVKLKKTGGEQKPAEAAEKKEKPPEVEILTPSEP